MKRKLQPAHSQFLQITASSCVMLSVMIDRCAHLSTVEVDQVEAQSIAMENHSCSLSRVHCQERIARISEILHISIHINFLVLGNTQLSSKMSPAMRMKTYLGPDFYAKKILFGLKTFVGSLSTSKIGSFINYILSVCSTFTSYFKSHMRITFAAFQNQGESRWLFNF